MLRRVAVLLMGVALLTAVVGSGALTSVEADRSVSIAVVDDDEAYVGYDAGDVSVTNTENQTATATLVEVTNRFPSSIDLTDVTVDSGDALHIEHVDDSGSIDPGSATEIQADISCDEVVNESVPVSVTLAGADVHAALDGDTETRLVSVDCAP